MRSYYTYGAVPDPVRTVRGFDNGGLASVDDYSTWKGSPELGASIMAFDKLQRERVLEPGGINTFVGPGIGTPLSAQGNFSMLRPERSAAELAADYAKLTGLDLAGFAASQGKTEQELMADINAAEYDPNTRTGALNRIKDLASAGDFKGAFEEAKAAEARVGGSFVGNLVSPSGLRYLVPEMTKEDVNKYYDALKETIGEKEYEKRYVSTGNKFSLEEARAKNLAAVDQGQNFVNPDAGVKAEETFLSKLPVKQLTALAAAAMGATAIPGLAGAGGAGGGAGAGAGAGAAGSTTGGGLVSGLKSAYQAVTGIPGTIGKTVAQTLGLPVNTALGQTALGNSIISAGTTAAKGGDIGDILKSGLIAAGVTYGLDAAVNAVKGVMPQATKAVSDQVANAAASTGVPASTALDALQEVVITSKKVGDLAGLGAAAGALTSARGTPSTVTPDQLEEIQIQSQKVPVTPEAGLASTTGALTTPAAKEPPMVTPDQLEELQIQSKKVPVEPVTATGALAGAVTPVIKEPPMVTPDQLEELQIQSKKVPVEPLTATGALTGAVTPKIKEPPMVTPDELEELKIESKKVPSKKPPVVVTTPSGLEEVQVEAKKVPPEPSEKPPIVIPEPTLKPPPETKDILKDYKPTEIKPEPPKSPVDLKTLLKILGALGSATSGTTGGTAAPSTGGGTGGFGGALPKYTYERQQFAPPIDYYTYGTRPEAKFFEGQYKLAEPVQPPLTPPPSEPSGVVTSAAGGMIHGGMTGGLIGYAHGGDTHVPEDYVEGPGSGRDDKIPALLSDGEYVIDAETLALLGDGSSKEGARRMDQFRAKIRQHKGRALSRGRISPNAKSPEKYMGGGLS